MATIPASYVLFTPPSDEHYPSKEATPLANASASGDFDTMKRILGSYLADQSPENYALQEFWPVLLTALAYDRPEIVSYLLDVGIPLALLHVQQAIETKSAAIFEVFLRHGWDINEPLSETQPPALAYVPYGANPNAACRLDLTPMSFVVQTIHLLFDRGGDIKTGQLVHHAIRGNNNILEVLQLLLQKGVELLLKVQSYRIILIFKLGF